MAELFAEDAVKNLEFEFDESKSAFQNLFDQYEYESKKNKHDNSALNELNEALRSNFGLQLPAERLTREAVIAELQNDITQKEELAGKENFNMFIRYQYVQIIDKNFTGISGVVKNLDLNKQTAGVSVSMFGRETIIELKLEDIVPIS